MQNDGIPKSPLVIIFKALICTGGQHQTIRVTRDDKTNKRK
jgi:hypothetical protein